MFKSSARNYLEMFILPSMQPETLLRNLDVVGLEYFEAALAVGKGVIIFTAHLGPFNYLGQWFAIKGYQVTIPVERMQNQRMLDLSLKLRGSQGMQMIPIGGSDAIRSMIKALRNNQIVMIVADRAVQGESIEKPFFGEPAPFPIGPVLLAQRTGATLVGAFGWYSSSNRLVGQFAPLSLALTEDDRMNTSKLMCAMIEKMEQFIRAHPEQWEVFSPLWTSDFAPTS